MSAMPLQSQELAPRSHTIIEAHPEVHARMLAEGAEWGAIDGGNCNRLQPARAFLTLGMSLTSPRTGGTGSACVECQRSICGGAPPVRTGDR